MNKINVALIEDEETHQLFIQNTTVPTTYDRTLYTDLTGMTIKTSGRTEVGTRCLYLNGTGVTKDFIFVTNRMMHPIELKRLVKVANTLEF